jgi:4-alpha-glucanotransferase
MSIQPDPAKKIAGFLAPLFAVRGQHDLGIGDVATLRELVDWAAAHDFGFVQMLPINETGCDHSPYNLFSSMAIEPLTISCHPNDLPDLSRIAYKRVAEQTKELQTGPVQYERVAPIKRQMLELACAAFFRKNPSGTEEYNRFCEIEAEWLDAYSLCKALAEFNKANEVYTNWPEEHRSFESATYWLAKQPATVRKRIEKLRDFFRYTQWIAAKQWHAANEYAASRGILLIGDVPVGVSIYSADVWAEPHLFDLTRSCGAPPEKVFRSDPFTEQWGQNWGFPLYNWFAMSKDNFRWWRRRLQALKRIFAMLRLDHVLGFYRIYSFPWRPERNAEFVGLTPEQARTKTGGVLPGFVPNDDDTPEHREANRVHGEVLLGVFIEETGAECLIAEDLGEVPPYVRPSLRKLGVPGFKIPQWEIEPDGTLTPGAKYPRLAIATYATHDHPPLITMWEEKRALAESGASTPDAEAARRELRGLLGFCGLPDSPIPPFSDELLGALLRSLFASNAWLAAVNVNDLFGTPDRFNTPGTTSGQNWTARLAPPVSEWDRVFARPISKWRDSLPRA